MQCYSVIKKKEILTIVTIWMDFEGIMRGEVSKIEKDKYRMSHLYMESKNIKPANDFIPEFLFFLCFAIST